MLRRTTIIVGLLVVLVLAGPCYCIGDEEIVNVFTIPAYAPMKLTISYALVENISKSDVSSFGQSLWRLETMPISASFNTDVVDVFSFKLTLNYKIRVSQYIVINVYSGSQQTQSTFNIFVNSSTLNFKFIIVVAQEPHFPTVEEYTNVVMENLPTKQDFKDWISYQRNQNEVANQNLIYMWATLGCIGVLAVASIFISLWKRRKEELP